MKRFVFGLFALLGPVLLAQQVPEISYYSVPDLLKLPKDMNLGEASGVAVNSRGHIFVFTRSNSATGTAYGAAAAQLFEFDADGKFVREIAKGLYVPGPSPIPSVSTATTTSGPWTKAPIWSSGSTPRAM